MSKAAEIYLALGIDKAPAIRRLAACVAFRLWHEMHLYGEFQTNIDILNRIMKRFRLADFVTAISAHYPLRDAINPGKP